MDTLLVALRVVLSLAVVLGLLWYVQRRVTRGPKAKRNASLVTVIGRQGIGQKASVVVVDVDGTRFVLGVTEQSVNVLQRDPQPAAAPLVERAVVEPAWRAREASGAAFARTLTDVTADAPLEHLPTFRPRRDRQGVAKPGKLAGSILSPATWQQTAAAFRQMK